MKFALMIAAGALALAGCAEQEQTAGGSKLDNAPFQGTVTTSPPYTTVGWKPGDRTSWEQQLKTRTTQGQNDYARVQ